MNGNLNLGLYFPDLVECLDGILPSLLEDNIQVWAMKSQSEHTQVNTLLDNIDAASDQPVPAELRATTSLKSPTLYIFTSGTTGESVLYSSVRTVHTNDICVVCCCVDKHVTCHSCLD